MVLDIRSLVPGQSKALLGKTGKSERKQSKSVGNKTSANDSDSVNITGQAGKINQLIEQMKSAPVVDPDRVSPVKEKLTKGEYQIKYQHVANKMLDFESSYGGY